MTQVAEGAAGRGRRRAVPVARVRLALDATPTVRGTAVAAAGRVPLVVERGRVPRAAVVRLAAAGLRGRRVRGARAARATGVAVRATRLPGQAGVGSMALGRPASRVRRLAGAGRVLAGTRGRAERARMPGGARGRRAVEVRGRRRRGPGARALTEAGHARASRGGGALKAPVAGPSRGPGAMIVVPGLAVRAARTVGVPLRSPMTSRQAISIGRHGLACARCRRTTRTVWRGTW